MRAEKTMTLAHARPSVGTVAELLKPITWFPPMWAFTCGAISSNASIDGRWPLILTGVALCGPLVCASSQATNDWFDRHVDAINEPQRPIPSGRMPGLWGLGIAVAWTGLSLMVAATLGTWAFGATIIGLALSWMYSAPPFRLKANGWWGNLACGMSYEGLAWITGAAVMLQGRTPPLHVIALAVLYSLGAHGIMTLNDFKAIDGDRKMGVRSLPVQLGAQNAGRVACVVMLVPQLVVVALLVAWGASWQPYVILGLVAVQGAMMWRFLGAPVARATWLSALAVNFYVAGMMISAFAVRGLFA